MKSAERKTLKQKKRRDCDWSKVTEKMAEQNQEHKKRKTSVHSSETGG